MYTNVRTRKQLAISTAKIEIRCKHSRPMTEQQKEGLSDHLGRASLSSTQLTFSGFHSDCSQCWCGFGGEQIAAPRGIPYALCCFGRIQWDKPRSWSIQTVRCRSLANLSGLTWLGKKTHLSNGRNLKFLFKLFACSNCSKLQIDYFVFPIKNKSPQKTQNAALSIGK